MDIIEVMNLRRVGFIEHVWENEECKQFQLRNLKGKNNWQT